VHLFNVQATVYGTVYCVHRLRLFRAAGRAFSESNEEYCLDLSLLAAGGLGLGLVGSGMISTCAIWITEMRGNDIMM